MCGDCQADNNELAPSPENNDGWPLLTRQPGAPPLPPGPPPRLPSVTSLGARARPPPLPPLTLNRKADHPQPSPTLQHQQQQQQPRVEILELQSIPSSAMDTQLSLPSDAGSLSPESPAPVGEAAAVSGDWRSGDGGAARSGARVSRASSRSSAPSGLETIPEPEEVVLLQESTDSILMGGGEGGDEEAVDPNIFGSLRTYLVRARTLNPLCRALCISIEQSTKGG